MSEKLIDGLVTRTIRPFPCFLPSQSSVQPKTAVMLICLAYTGSVEERQTTDAAAVDWISAIPYEPIHRPEHEVPAFGKHVKTARIYSVQYSWKRAVKSTPGPLSRPSSPEQGSIVPGQLSQSRAFFSNSRSSSTSRPSGR